MGGASSIVAKSTWLIGVFLAIGADVLSNLGTNLQKLAHTQLEAQQDRMLQQQDSSSDNPDNMLDIPTPPNEAAIDIEPIQDDLKPPFEDEEPAGAAKPEPESKPSYTQSPTWILGIALLILSAVADFLALLFASQSIVSPLGSLTLVVNLFLARWMHGEVITVTGVVATMLIVAGSFLTVAFADHSVLNLDLDGILNLYFTPRFVVYALLVGSSITMIWYYAVKWSKEKVNAEDHPEIYPLFKLSIACLNGTLGGHNVLFAKLTVELLSVGKLQCLTHPMFYFTLAMLVMTIVTQVSWLNEGLRRFDAIFMIPVSTAFWVFFSVFSGIVTTGEYARMTWDEISFFTLGMMFILVGVLIFSRHKAPSTAQQAARMEKAKKSMKFLPPMSLKTLSSKNDVQSPLESPTATREDQTLYLPKKYS